LKLDAGEKEALALAQELGGVPILMDERKGRIVAKSFGLITTGTLNIIEEAAVANLLDIDEALRKLNETSFYLSAELINRFKKQVTERKS
jgi:predicted nucleic acid-binding protein